MVGCQDCIHYEVCDYRDTAIYGTIQDLKNDCRHCIPASDVVPKAEVEVYKNALSKSNEYMERTKKLFEEESQNTKRAIEIINKWEEKYKTAKQEVAREIFEEIDLNLEDYIRGDIRGNAMVARLYSLKKKYLEGE